MVVIFFSFNFLIFRVFTVRQRAQQTSRIFFLFTSFSGAYFVIFATRLASGKCFAYRSSYSPNILGTSLVSCLVPANTTRRSRFCRFIARILWFKPLISHSIDLGMFQIHPFHVQLSTRSGQVSTTSFSRSDQIWSSSVKVKKCSVQIWADRENSCNALIKHFVSEKRVFRNYFVKTCGIVAFSGPSLKLSKYSVLQSWLMAM